MSEEKTVRVIKVNADYIEFSNGDRIIYDHEPDCCEYNYADFKQVKDEIMGREFKMPIQFEMLEHGFRFGNEPYMMFYVPCYSDQNGYYTDELDIYYAKHVMGLPCEVRLD